MPCRVEPEHFHFPGGWPKQIQQTLDRRGLAGAVAAKESVAAAGLNTKAQAVHSIRPAVTADEVIEIDDWCLGVHEYSGGCGLSAFFFKQVKTLFGELKKLFSSDLQVMGLDHSRVDFVGHEPETNLFLEWRIVRAHKTAFARHGFDHALAFKFRISFGNRVAVDAKLFGQRPDGRQRLARLKGTGAGRGFDLVHHLKIDRLARLEIELKQHGASSVSVIGQYDSGRPVSRCCLPWARKVFVR